MKRALFVYASAAASAGFLQLVRERCKQRPPLPVPVCETAVMMVVVVAEAA